MLLYPVGASHQGGAQQVDEKQTALDAATDIQQQPTRFTGHDFLVEPRERQQVRQQQVEVILRPHRTEVGDGLDVGPVLLNIVDDAPGIRRPAVADGVGSALQRLQRRQQDAALVVAGEYDGAQFLPGAQQALLAAATDKIRQRARQPGHCAQQLVQAGYPRFVAALAAGLEAFQDDPQQARHTLGALGVAPDPEQILASSAGENALVGVRFQFVPGTQPQADGALWFLGQHPGVLADAARLGRHHKAVMVGRDTRQPPWHGRVAVVMGDQEGPQDGVPWLQTIFYKGRCRRE